MTGEPLRHAQDYHLGASVPLTPEDFHADVTSRLPCPFCEIAEKRAPAIMIHEWDDTIAFVPLNPVVEGHTLVVPRFHVPDFAAAPDVSALTMFRAAELMQWTSQPSNLITSRGAEATQTVRHLHLHLVPRSEGDGLSLPWSNQRHTITEGGPDAAT